MSAVKSCVQAVIDELVKARSDAARLREKFQAAQTELEEVREELSDLQECCDTMQEQEGIWANLLGEVVACKAVKTRTAQHVLLTLDAVVWERLQQWRHDGLVGSGGGQTE